MHAEAIMGVIHQQKEQDFSIHLLLGWKLFLVWTVQTIIQKTNSKNSTATKLQASWQISPISMNKQMQAWIGHEAISSLRFLLASLKSLTHTCVTDS